MMFTLKVIICGYVHAVSWFLYTAYPHTHTHTLAASTIHEHKKKHAWSLVSFISPLCSFHHWKSFPLRCMVNECVFQFASHETRLVMAPLQQSTWFSHQRTPPGCESSFENSSKDFCWYLGRSKTFIVHWCMIWYNWHVLSSWPVITIFTTDLFWCFQPLSGTTRCDNFNEMTRNEDFFNQETGRFAIKCANRTTSKRVIGPSIDSMAKNRKHLCDMFGWKFKAVNPSGPYVQGFLFQSFFETVLQKRTCSNTHRWMFPAFPHASQFLRLLKPKNPAVFIRKKKTKTLKIASMHDAPVGAEHGIRWNWGDFEPWEISLSLPCCLWNPSTRDCSHPICMERAHHLKQFSACGMKYIMKQKFLVPTHRGVPNKNKYQTISLWTKYEHWNEIWVKKKTLKKHNWSGLLKATLHSCSHLFSPALLAESPGPTEYRKKSRWEKQPKIYGKCRNRTTWVEASPDLKNPNSKWVTFWPPRRLHGTRNFSRNALD